MMPKSTVISDYHNKKMILQLGFSHAWSGMSTAHGNRPKTGKSLCFYPQIKQIKLIENDWKIRSFNPRHRVIGG